MINGDPKDFIEVVYSGQDIPFLFRGQKFWYQGYVKNDKWHMEIMECFPPCNYRWECDVITCDEGVDAFLKAPMFDGKTFWEVEHEIEWLDEQLLIALAQQLTIQASIHKNMCSIFDAATMF